MNLTRIPTAITQPETQKFGTMNQNHRTDVIKSNAAKQ